MKKKQIVNLIKYHAEQNESAFKNEAYEIAKDFDASGDTQLAMYIMGLVSSTHNFIPQNLNIHYEFLTKMSIESYDPLPLPDKIRTEILGISNAISKKLPVNKFLFYGAPGTGKTETAKQVCRLVNRELYTVDFSSLIDSHLGQTGKNIATLFHEIEICSNSCNAIILFDEIDSLVLQRSQSNDHREIGRATSEFLKKLDTISQNTTIIATTNLSEQIDKAILRRFDAKIDFNRYKIEDLVEIAEILLRKYSKDFNLNTPHISLTKKIIKSMKPLLSPGELKNAIKTSIAFSDPKDSTDYLKRLYEQTNQNYTNEPEELRKKGFTFREIELLTNISKSNVERMLKEKL